MTKKRRGGQPPKDRFPLARSVRPPGLFTADNPSGRANIIPKLGQASDLIGSLAARLGRSVAQGIVSEHAKRDKRRIFEGRAPVGQEMSQNSGNQPLTSVRDRSAKILALNFIRT
jgi:hypothetical protein